MKVYIAEKPSQASDIAKIIGIRSRDEGYITLVDGDVITWAVGHLLRQLTPNDYKAEWARWNWATLPMVPEQWKYAPEKTKTKQINIIKGLLKRASSVVIATDAGREGELIARELLEHFGYTGELERLWLSALTDSKIREALTRLRPGASTEPLYHAALARAHADWLFGFNMSRGVTLARNVKSPVGRVKTPTLHLVVKRDLEIANFRAETYFELEASIATANGHQMKMLHAPDVNHRITEKKAALRLMQQATGAQGALAVERKSGKEAPPLPYSLPTLQKDASKALGLTAARTLEVAQALYEAKVITYPRTDCPYLDTSLQMEVPATLTAIKKNDGALVDTFQSVSAGTPVFRKNVFNDDKISDHHGIIPTTEYRNLSGVEERMYRLIAVRYLQALSPDRLFDGTRVELDANGVPFSATGRVITRTGWGALKF